MRLSILALLTCALAAHGHVPEAQLPFENPHAHGRMEGHAHAGWDSRYFSEGRDMLDGDSLWYGSAELGWEHFAGGLWYGRSPDRDYDELQLSLALTGYYRDLEFYGAYTHLRFPFDDSHDHEIGAGVAWSGLPLECSLAVDAYYSFQAEGMFSEMSVTRDLQITESLTIDLSCIFGLNLGYVPDGHDGANHIAMRLGAAYAITDSFSVTAMVAYSRAIDKDELAPGDDLLVDFLHGGIGLEWSF